MRKLLLLLAAVVLILVLVKAVGGNRKAIAQARADAARLASRRDSLVTVVREREQLQAALTLERQSKEAETNRLRDSVTLLETRRAAFPELGDLGFGLTSLPFEDGDTLGLEYLLVPAWFAETFVIDHANAASWRAQKDQLLAVDSLRLVVTALQDSITQLETANLRAYETGYPAAYTGYQDLSQRYVAELKKPRFKLPSTVALLAAAGGGVVLGLMVQR